MAIAFGDKLAIVRRDVSGLSGHAIIFAESNGALLVPLRREGGGLSAMKVELASADDDTAFVVRRDGGGLSIVKPTSSPCTQCGHLAGNIYTITFDGLAGDFAVVNGAHNVTMLVDCTGTTTLGDFTILLTRRGTPPWPLNWRVQIVSVALCYMWFEQPSYLGACDPTGEHEPWSGMCDATHCTDTNSCGDSVGATCVVS